MRKRAPIDLTKGACPRGTQLDTAAWIIDRSGLASALQDVISRATGRPRILNDVRAMLIVAQANALSPHHTAHLTSVGRVIDALSDKERRALGFPAWDTTTGYCQVHRFFQTLSALLATAPLVYVHGEPVVLDHQEFLTRMLQASIADDLPTSNSVALDSTDLETWGALYGDPNTVVDENPGAASPKTGKRRSTPAKVKIHGYGDDGRPIYTADIYARGGYRSGTNSRPAGRFVGYDLHTLAQARDLIWTNYIDETKLSPEVPNVILGAKLAPARTHNGHAVMAILERLRRDRPGMVDLMVDQGYTQLANGNFLAPVRKAGYRPVFELHPYQRGQFPFTGDAALVDGGLFSAHLPQHLLGTRSADGRISLPMPPIGATAEQICEFQKPFNQRARYRYSVHAGPDADGYRRLRCPFCARRACARAFRETMRHSNRVPMLPIEGSLSECCSGILTATATDLALWQDIPFGTTAWHQSYNRRNCVESVNAALKGQYVLLRKGYQAFLRADLITLMLAFTLAGVNIDRSKAYRDKHELTAPVRYCRRRRAATLDDVITHPC